MTSRLRRKRRTTVQSTLRRTVPAKRSTRRLPLGAIRLTAFWLLACVPILAPALPFRSATADEPPGRLEVDHTAKPLQSTGTDHPENASSVTARWKEVKRRQVGHQPHAWRLKWRSPLATSDQLRSSQAPSRSAEAASAEDTESDSVRRVGLPWREADRTAAVRQAVQLNTADPFNDPFGDSEAVQSVPEQTSTSDEEAPAPPRSISQAPPAEIEEERGERIYNQRDCREVQEDCREAWEDVQAQSIRDISLDITPRLTKAQLGGDDDRAYGEELRRELAKSEPRVWHDRSGKEIAQGQLRNFQNRRVVIESDEGQRFRIPFDELSDDDMCFVAAWWSVPAECPLGDEQFEDRQWIASTMTWKASAVCHKPLYFEEVQLERYGHTAGPLLQPALSGAHFFLNIAAVPYKMGMHPVNECRYPLGYYRPGNCAPWLVPPIPLSLRGGLLAGGFYTGGTYIIP